MRLRTADGIGAGTNAKIYINFKIMLFLDIFSFLRRFQTHIPLLYYLTKQPSSKSSFQLIFGPFSAFSGPSGGQKRRFRKSQRPRESLTAFPERRFLIFLMSENGLVFLL